MWEQLQNWWRQTDIDQGILWSSLFVVLSALVYLIFRKRIYTVGTNLQVIRTRRRLLAVGLLLILLLSLTRIWLQHPYGSAISEQHGQVNVLTSLLWTLFAGGIAYVLVKTMLRSLLRHETELETRHRVRQLANWGGVLVFCVALLFIWGSQFQGLGVFLGIIGAGLALSMGETLLCIAGWAILVVRRPFDIGDRIEINQYKGDVIGYGLFHISMVEVGNWVHAEQSTGRMVHVPNSSIVRNAVFNYTKGFPFIWDEFATVVTFESDWEQAKVILRAEAEEEADKIETEVKRHIGDMQQRYAIRYNNLRPIVYTTIADNGILLTLRYLTPVRERRATNHRISEDVLRQFLQHPNIDLAYPTTRFYRNIEEGKPALGGPDKTDPPPKASHTLG